MIDIMDNINNHFLRSTEYGTFEITEDSIKGLTDTYLVGMYIIIKGSYLNDGIYKITAVNGGEITVDATLNPENTSDYYRVYASSPPADFVTLATEIENYNETGVGASGESIDDYSITYNGDGSWESVYKSKLNKYRRVYSDLVTSKYLNTSKVWPE